MSVRDKITNGKYTLTHDQHHAAGSMAAIRRANHLLKNNLKQDLLSENKLTNHPKADKIFDLAWEYGHANGLLEVVGHFEEFMELIKD